MEKKQYYFSLVIIFLSIQLVACLFIGFCVGGYTETLLLLNSLFTAIILFAFLIFRLICIVRFRKVKLIYPFFIGVVALVIGYLNPFESISESMKSPVVAEGYCKHTMTSLWLSLRKDNTFDLNSGAFLKKEMYYGNYQVKKDSLFLYFDKKADYHIDTLLITPHFITKIGDSTKHRHSYKLTMNELATDTVSNTRF